MFGAVVLVASSLQDASRLDLGCVKEGSDFSGFWAEKWALSLSRGCQSSHLPWDCCLTESITSCEVEAVTGQFSDSDWFL